MTDLATQTIADPEPEAPSPEGESGRRKLGAGFWVPAAWVALVLFAAVLGPVLPGIEEPNDPDPCAPYAIEVEDVLGVRPAAREDDIAGGIDPEACTADSKPGALPSTLHPLGTDSQGRDTLARLIAGARVAMLAGVVTIAIGMVIGGTVGLIAGYFGGRVETVLMAFNDVLLAFPTLVLALAIVTILGQGLTNAMVAITIVAIPAFARIARANTLTFAQREFVTAARVMGAKDSRIIIREILPNVIFPVMAFALVAVAIAIVAEGSLAFLSLSVQDPQASWGQMILDGRGVLEDQPLVAMVPATAMFLTVLAFNVLGDKFREIFNVKDAAL